MRQFAFIFFAKIGYVTSSNGHFLKRKCFFYKRKKNQNPFYGHFLEEDLSSED